MSLDITSGFPSVNPTTTAYEANGGTSDIIVDNDADSTTYPEAASIYYTSRNGVRPQYQQTAPIVYQGEGSLFKLTQNGLN